MFFLLQVLAVLAVVFGVAAVLTGRADGMSDEPQDLASVGIPRDRAMTPDDVLDLRFALALRGYRMDEVDDALDRLAAEIAARDEAIARLRAELDAAQARLDGSGEEPAGTPGDATGDPYDVFAPPRDEEPAPAILDALSAPVTPDAPDVLSAPAAPATPPPLPSTAPAWATERRDADDYVASDATGEVAEETPVDVPTTPEGWQELDPAIATGSGPAAPEFTEPASPFRPEVPDIPYDPWAVTPRSRYTDGPTYVEVEHDDEEDAVEQLGEHHTGYAPPPPGGEGAPVAEATGGNDASDVAAAEQAVEDARSGALGGGELPGAGGVPGASEGDEEPAAPPQERPWQS